MEKMRKAAIFSEEPSKFEQAKNLAKALDESGAFKDGITLFTMARDIKDLPVTAKVIPESCDTISKARNYINMSYKMEGYTGYLHVIEDHVQIMKDPREFLNALEKMMDILDYDVWFNTICDPCNYVYQKFNPRISISLDVEDVKNLGISKKILFTSHSNTAWICYDFSKACDDLLKFNESFDIPMFMIIEFLARRRNTRKSDQLYRMNMYATIPEEIGIFRIDQESSSKEVSQSKMAEEDLAFKKLEVNYAPDNNIDEILENLWSKLQTKFQTTDQK